MSRGPLFAILVATVAAVLAALSLAPTAVASFIVARNAHHPTLKLSKRGYALVQYTLSDGSFHNVFFWGAVNGVANPNLGRRQERFKNDYTGGWARFGNAKRWKTVRDACRPYDGPPLVLFVAGCKAPDGSYWALQEWVRLAPMRGLPPFKPEQTAVELHLSHWSGALPLLEVWPNWTYRGRWQGFFGRLTYQGSPVFGNQSSSFGQYVFIDTFNSVYGPGWKHDAAKALHMRSGAFCYSFVPQRPPPDYPTHAVRGPGLGQRHRVAVVGPGVMPIVRWEGPRLGAYNPVRDQQINRIFDGVLGGDRVCAKER
jgi:hypothetical protein